MKKINKRINPLSRSCGTSPLTGRLNFKFGFTLIEILVVVGAVMLVILSVSGVMSGVFSSQDKNKADYKIDQNGSWVLLELKKNILNANSREGNFVCPEGGSGSSIEMISVKDGEKTTISCDGETIASYSAERKKTVNLFEKNKDLELADCSKFVTCNIPSSQLSSVSFKFILKAGNESLSSGTTRVFSMDVTLRN